jgi:hypothetical protein
MRYWKSGCKLKVIFPLSKRRNTRQPAIGRYNENGRTQIEKQCELARIVKGKRRKINERKTSAVCIPCLTYSMCYNTHVITHAPVIQQVTGAQAVVFPHHLWQPKFRHRVHTSSPLRPVLNHTNSVHTPICYNFKTDLIISSDKCGLFPSSFRLKFCKHLLPLTCMLHLDCIWKHLGHQRVGTTDAEDSKKPIFDQEFPRSFGLLHV